MIPYGLYVINKMWIDAEDTYINMGYTSLYYKNLFGNAKILTTHFVSVTVCRDSLSLPLSSRPNVTLFYLLKA